MRRSKYLFLAALIGASPWLVACNPVAFIKEVETGIKCALESKDWISRAGEPRSPSCVEYDGYRAQKETQK